jgi:hypothetical protein
MKPMLLSIVTLILPISGWSGNTPCVKATLASYIDLGQDGCIVGDKLFFGFSYEASAEGGAREIPATELIVNPAQAPFNSWLEFSADWRIESQQTQRSVIRYSVFGLRRIGEIAELGLEGTGFTAGMFGTVSVNESTNAGDLSVFLECIELCRLTPSDSVKTDPVRLVEVVDDVTLTARFGGATLSTFIAGFSSLACADGESQEGCS